MTVVSRDVEHEVKLAMRLGADLPDLRAVVGASVRQPEEHLHTLYFDTSDRRLWNRGITLRHRSGDGTSKWMLKLPLPTSGDALVRTEVEWEADDTQIPEEARQAVLGIVRQAPLRNVAELHTERIRFLLESDGTVWAELANDVVTVVGGRANGLRFRQVELENTSRSPDFDRDARTVVKALRRAGARPDADSKLEKVLGPPKRKRHLGPKSRAEDLVRQAISAGLARLLDHDCRLRVAGPDLNAEDVHQARVATRRLRSDLGTLERLLDPVWVGRVRGELRWAGDALGAVRDVDVLTQGLREGGADDRVIQMLADERVSAVEALRQTLTERRYVDLLGSLDAASARPPVADTRLADRKARQVLPPLVRTRWKKLRRDARKCGRCPTDDELHQVRKRSKQLRYASELATPVIGKAAKKTAKASESLQTLLGEHHDAVVAADWLRRADHRDDLLDVGALIQHESARRKETGRKWRSRYKRLARPAGWLKSSVKLQS